MASEQESLGADLSEDDRNPSTPEGSLSEDGSAEEESHDSRARSKSITSTRIDRELADMVHPDNLLEIDEKISGRRLQRKSKTNCEKFIGEMAHKGSKGYNPRDSPPEVTSQRRNSLDSPKRKGSSVMKPQLQAQTQLKKKLEGHIGGIPT